MTEPRLTIDQIVDAIIDIVEAQSQQLEAGNRFDVTYDIPEYVSNEGVGLVVMLLAASPRLSALGVRCVISHNDKHTFERLSS